MKETFIDNFNTYLKNSRVKNISITQNGNEIEINPSILNNHIIINDIIIILAS